MYPTEGLLESLFSGVRGRLILRSSKEFSEVREKSYQKVCRGFEGCLWGCVLLIGPLAGRRAWYSRCRGVSVEARSALSGSRRGEMRTLADRGRLVIDAPFLAYAGSTQKSLALPLNTV